MSSSTGGEDPSVKILLRRWYAVCALCVLFVASGFTLLRLVWGESFAFRWLILSIFGISYLLIILGRNLKANHRIGETGLLPAFGWGNGLTILRGILVAGLAGFLFSPRPEGWVVWLPGILYTLSDVTDFFDGYAARRTNHVTRLGEILDMSLDGTGVLVAAALAVQYGQVPVWYLGVALARPLFLGGMWLRSRLGLPNHELPESISRRVFAGLQMGFLAVVLWPLFLPPGTHLAAAVFALPFLAGFMRDWLVVSGVVRSGQSSPFVWLDKIMYWMPGFFRLVILMLSFSLLLPYMRDFRSISAQMQIFLLLEILVVCLIFTGTAGRVASILGMLLIGFYQMYGSLHISHMILVPAYALILFMGTGPYSLWKPEDALIFRHVGERNALLVERRG